GFTWIALVAMVAVLAPSIANSRPYLMKTAEGWSSPLLGGLSAVDVLLLVLFAAVVVTLLVRGLATGTRVALVLLTGSLIAPFAFRVAAVEWWTDPYAGLFTHLLISVAFAADLLI